MLIDWLKFPAALFLLLLPIGLFHGQKIRFLAISRDWEGRRSLILTLGLHWIDLGRAALGGWLLLQSLALDPGALGFMRYSVPLTLGAIMILAVCLQTFVCKEPDSANAPFAFVTGMLFGVFTPVTAGFPFLIALTAAAGSRVPVAYFPVLALSLAGVGYVFDGRKTVVLLACGCCATLAPWLLSIMFPRELVLSYRAKRSSKDTASPLPPHR